MHFLPSPEYTVSSTINTRCSFPLPSFRTLAAGQVLGQSTLRFLKATAIEPFDIHPIAALDITSVPQIPFGNVEISKGELIISLLQWPLVRKTPDFSLNPPSNVDEQTLEPRNLGLQHILALHPLQQLLIYCPKPGNLVLQGRNPSLLLLPVLANGFPITGGGMLLPVLISGFRAVVAGCGHDFGVGMVAGVGVGGVRAGRVASVGMGAGVRIVVQNIVQEAVDGGTEWNFAEIRR